MIKRKHFKAYIVIFAMSMFLTGCGVTPLYEMSDEEQDYIVKSAAYFVAKHNIKQTDGASAYKPTDEDINGSTEEVEDPNDPMAGINLDDPDIAGMISYSEAIGQPKVDITYNGLYVDKSYQEGKYYLLTAEEGHKYVILKYTMRNPYVDAMKVDAYSANPVFYADFGDGNYIKQESTFLTYSLPTYQGTLKPGKSIELALVFQVDESFPGTSELKTMQVEVGGKKYYINPN